MSLIFEWDPAKNKINKKKHIVSFDEASSIFGDNLSITIDEPQKYLREYRFVTIGMSNKGRLLVVIHTERDDRIRIISARKATSKESRDYRG